MGRELLLTKLQYKNPPVGSGMATPMTFAARLRPPWQVLIVSDGVWKTIGWEQIALLARQQIGEALVAALREAVAAGWGGKLPDDFSVILLEERE